MGKSVFSNHQKDGKIIKSTINHSLSTYVQSRSKKKNASVNNIIQEKKERISGVEDTIEEIDSSVKQNVKSKKN